MSLRLLLASALLASLLCAFSGAQGDHPAYALVGVVTEEPSDVQALADAGFDIWEVGAHQTRVLTRPAERQWLVDHGYSFSKVPDLDAFALSQPGRLAVDGYLTFDEYVADMQGWAADHPDIVSLTSVGTTWEGRDLWMLKISDNVASDEDEPEVLMIGLQHAREWLGGMTLHGVAEHFITTYGSDSTVTDLIDSMEIYVLLVANPDGYVYTHTTDRFWRKNRRDNGDGTFGVDLNRNFDWAWSPEVPSSNTYGGPAPFSEPETVALRDWLVSRGDALVGVLNYHTYGTRVMHNWAHTYDLPPNADVMGPLARDVATAIEAVNGQRMRNGSWAITLEYLGNGATNDWVHAALGIPTLTLELRPGDGATGGFAPTGASIAPSISENIPGAVTFLQWVRTRAADVTPPIITDLTVKDISNTRATLSWTTDDPATRAVEYGLTTAYGSSQEPDRLRGRTHSVTLTGLTPSTQYHARARAENIAALSAVSGDLVFTTAPTPQDITPPDYPPILTLRRSGAASFELTWTDLETSGVLGHRLWESIDGEHWSRIHDESTLSAGVISATLPSPPPLSPRLYRLTAVDTAPARNESIPSDTYAIMVGDGATPVLIVDGYDRWNQKPVSQGLNHRFAADHGLAVAAAGLPFDTCANQEVGVSVNLTDYQIVIWVLGDESTATETFSASEQAAVRSFLDGGGSLFVSGSNVAYDLDRPTGPTAADRSFFNNYLCADFVRDDMDDYDVNGSGGASIFGTQLIRFDEGSRGIYRVDDPDVVTPVDGAVAALRSPTGEVCGIQREGLFGAGTAPGHVVYLTFPFETIFPESARSEVMRDVLTFFGAPVSAQLTGFAAF